MEKIYNEYFDETYYLEELENGLKVILFSKPSFLTTTCAFGTPYGALGINQKADGKEYHFHPGVAHFLEHKLFESTDHDIMSDFSALGANVNAFTSYHETVYYFSTSEENIDEPLNLLLDFVQHLNISEESVEKEKGIIAQEVSMYMQMPDSRLVNETYKAMYENYPLIHDIGGDRKDVYAITKAELDECYALNYHPSNMVLMITTPCDPEKVMELVRNNQKTKEFSKRSAPISADPEEPLQVRKEEYTFNMPINKAKRVFAYKLKPNFKDGLDVFFKEWCMRILLEAHFSSLNPKYQSWLDNKIINDFFGYDVDFDMNSAYVMFYIENDDRYILKSLVLESLQEKLLNEDLLKQIKRRFIGSAFSSFNDIEGFTLGYIRDYLGGIDFFESIRVLMNITLDDIYNVYNSFCYDNSVFVSVESLNKAIEE